MKSSKEWVRSISLILVLVLPGLAAAETRFITDSFEVTMRSGKGTSFSITRLLRSGLPVELLETDTESGYSYVRLSDGTEGWVITRYLMDSPSARDQLAQLRSRSAALSEQLRATQEQLAQTESTLTTTRAQLEAVIAERDGLQTDLDDLRRETADTIAIARNNRELQKQRAVLQQQLDELMGRNRALADQSEQQWFMVGGGVLLVGILLGILVTRIRWQRRRRWDEL